MNNRVQLFIGFFLLAGAAALGIVGVIAVGRWLLALNPQLSGPVVAGIIGFASLIYVQWHSKTREIQQSHRPQKIEVYNEFFEILARFLKNPGDRDDIEEGELPPEMRDQFWNLNRGLIVWGSPRVIRAWLRFRRLSGEQSGPETLLLMDEVLQAMRADLGNRNFGLARGDAVKVFLSDPQELDGTSSK
jgi:hypothetical protein